jgi:CTP synthase (UTP-ammonia lyase)
MTQPVRIAIVGDYNQDSRSHVATNEALTRTADCRILVYRSGLHMVANTDIVR